MNTILVVMFLYFAGMLLIGMYAQKQVKTSEDFLVGGHKLSIWVTTLAHQAAAMSGWMFLAWAGQVVKMGLGAVYTAISAGTAPITNFAILARRVRALSGKVEARSFIDMLESRYYDEKSRVLRIVSAVIMVAFLIIYAGSQIMAAGTTFEFVLGWDYKAAVIVGALVVIAYTSAGGMLAVAWTDFVQGGLMLLAVAMAVVLSLSQAGSTGSVVARLRDINPALGSLKMNPITAFGLIFASILGYFGQPHLVQMFFGLKNEKEAGRGTLIAAACSTFLLGGSFIALLGISLINYGRDIKPDLTLLVFFQEHLSPVLMGVAVAAVLAAIMSSADMLLHVCNTTITQDVYNKILKGGKATEREILTMGRIVTVVVGVLSILVAIFPFEGLMWVIWTAFGGLSVFGPLVLLGCYWERATREGAIAGAITGVAAVLVFFFTGWYNTLHLAVVAFIFSALAMVAVSLLTPPPPERIRELVKSLSRG
ncbi:MAG: Sodium/proline symporter [Firmicutes bacterium ADurb.Bin506]|nr:MAG: Sodium/proline symporter [Firmicutes bacterium ADurb.Bin506]